MEKQIILEPESKVTKVPLYIVGCWTISLIKNVAILAIVGYVIGYMAFGGEMSMQELLISLMIAAGLIVCMRFWWIIRLVIALGWRIVMGALVLWVMF